MDFNPAKILKVLYSKPIYISSRATSLAVKFVPKGSHPAISILEHFDRAELGTTGGAEQDSDEVEIKKWRHYDRKRPDRHVR